MTTAPDSAASIDPRRTSPKVTAVTRSGLVVTVALAALAAALLAVPQEALEPLGRWALPAGAAIATVANRIKAYQTADPAREPSVQVLDGQVFTDPGHVHDGDGHYTGLVPGQEATDPTPGRPPAPEARLTEEDVAQENAEPLADSEEFARLREAVQD